MIGIEPSETTGELLTLDVKIIPYLQEITVGDPDAPEKFQDPLYSCWGTGPDRGIEYRWRAWYPNEYGAPSDVPLKFNIGYEYLSGVPNIARDRIRAIRKKIDEYRAEFPASDVTSTSTSMQNPLEEIRYQSWKHLEKLASGIVEKYGNAKDGAEQIANSIPGFSWERAEQLATDLANTYAGADQIMARYKVISTAAKNIAPVAIAIAGAIQKIYTGFTSELSSEEKANLTAHAISDVAKLVPFYGQIVGAAADSVLAFWDKAIADEKAREDAEARFAGAKLADIFQLTSDKGVPFPLHVSQWWSPHYDKNHRIEVTPAFFVPEGFVGTPSQYDLWATLRWSLDVFSGTVKSDPKYPETTVVGTGLTAEQVDLVKRWWGTATTFMSDPQVYDVFRALGWDLLGGTVASDEQVMLVAAPIAVSHGFDVDKFAMALHASSKGWRAEVAEKGGAVRSKMRMYSTPYAMDWKNWLPCHDGPDMMVQNAWWLNLARLSRDAFELAKTFGKVEGEVPPLREPTSAIVTVGLPAAAGVAAGFMFGGPIGLAVGAASWLLTSWLSSD
jgi:hypothetical protein